MKLFFVSVYLLIKGLILLLFFTKAVIATVATVYSYTVLVLLKEILGNKFYFGT